MELLFNMLVNISKDYNKKRNNSSYFLKEILMESKMGFVMAFQLEHYLEFS